MYTNPLLGCQWDERHVWTPAQQQRLEAAAEAGGQAQYTAETAMCEAVAADVATPLVRVREYDVPVLPAFLYHDQTCSECEQQTLEHLGIQPDDLGDLYEGEFSLEDTSGTLDEPDWVGEQYHAQGTQEVRSQWYDEQDEARSTSEKVQEWLEGAEGLAHLVSADVEDVALGEAHDVVPTDGPHAGETIEAVVVQNGGDENRPVYVDDGDHSYLVGGPYLEQANGSPFPLTDEDRERFRAEHGTLEWQGPEDERTNDAADALRLASQSYAAFTEYGQPSEGSTPLTFDPQQFTLDPDSFSIEAQVDRAVENAVHGAAQAAREHSFDMTVRLTEDQAEDLRKHLGLE